MSEDQVAGEVGKFSKHKFVIMVSISIIVALLLTVVSMLVYNWSGTAQIDLSRPGFQSVQKEAKSSEKYDGFSATGDVTSRVLDDFKKTYSSQSNKVLGINAFAGNVLDDSTLKIDDPALLQDAAQ